MKHSKILSVALAGTLALSSLSMAFAATSDIPENHWAKSSIDAVVQKGIMNLYDGDKFNPNAPATQLEAVVTLYRVADKYGLVNKADVLKWSLHYEKELASYGIPKTLATYGNDVYLAMAYAIEMGIVTPIEAKAFVSGGQLTQVNKVTMSVFTGRALNVYKKDKLNPMVTLTYKDASAIPLSAMRYVDFLVENKIVSAKGDAKGNFSPQSPLTRAVLASFINGYVDVIATLAPNPEEKTEEPKVEEPKTEEPKTEKPVDPTTNVQGERLLAGEIVNYKGGSNIRLKTDLGEESVDLYQVPIFYNGGEVGLQAMANGLTVKVKMKNDRPYEATVDTVFDKIDGTFFSLGAPVSVTPSFRPLSIKTSDANTVPKRLPDDAVIYIDGVVSTVDELKSGDRIQVYYDGHTVKTLFSYSPEYESTAVLIKDYDVAKKGSVAMVTEKGFFHTFPSADSIVLLNKEAGFGKDVIVKVKIQNGQVTKLENIGKKEVILGTVSEIHIKERPELTLKVNTKTVKLPLSEQVIYLDELAQKQLSIYDLRLNQPVTVYKGLGGVYKLQLGQVREVNKEESIYTVTQVFASQGLMTVIDKDGHTKTVLVRAETGIKLLEIKVGDTLIIEGTFLNNDLIEAVKITVKK